MRKDVEKLCRLIQPEIAGILAARGLIESNAQKFGDIKLTQEGKAKIGMGDSLITEKWFDKWRSMWPPKYKGDRNVARAKLNRFVSEHDKVSLNDIIMATQYWIDNIKYHGRADYFFYKKNESGVEECRCLQAIESMKSPGANIIESNNVDIIE